MSAEEKPAEETLRICRQLRRSTIQRTERSKSLTTYYSKGKSKLNKNKLCSTEQLVVQDAHLLATDRNDQDISPLANQSDNSIHSVLSDSSSDSNNSSVGSDSEIDDEIVSDSDSENDFGMANHST